MNINYFECLTELLPPPTSPVMNSGDWNEAENSLGCAFPDDYKQLIGTYGVGTIKPAFIWFYSPIDNLTFGINEFTRTLEEAKLEGYEIPFSAFPPIGGLLSWGRDDNGGFLTWRTDSDLVNYDIVVFSRKCYEFQWLTNTSMTRCMVELLEGTSPLFSQMFAKVRFAHPFTFIPYNPRTKTIIEYRSITEKAILNDFVRYEVGGVLSFTQPKEWSVIPVAIKAANTTSQQKPESFFSAILENVGPKNGVLRFNISRVLDDQSATAIEQRDTFRNKLKADREERVRGMEYSIREWFREGGLEEDENEIRKAIKSDLDERRFIIGEHGELLGDSHIIPWIVHTDSPHNWNLTYFWNHKGKWKMNVTLILCELSEWKPVIDDVALSVKFLS